VVDLVNADPEEKLTATAHDLAKLFAGHFEKENSILYPSALEVIAESEWHSIRSQFDEIGYTSLTPETSPPPAGAEKTHHGNEQGKLMFSAGALSINEIEAIFDNLPVDITFIDNEDTVRYFNQAPGRIFVRSEAIIGRKVQNCHPQKSVHVVNRILDDFKSGRRDEASFWIDLPGKTAYIRYFPVKDKDGSYLGTIEVSQDIKPIRELDGEKRLLDEETKDPHS
jgi:PAS domain S-box-containing protein